ncbi:MAG: hypothetical protein HGA62_09545 [Chlorobiaceae bacterium]|nr:hypothetical protein [Chlorobiaceae bacterium]NTV59976.1 hypothetical protein [Chlorobiaceae bacterium]
MKNATLKNLATAAAIALSLFTSATLLASTSFSPAATLADAEQTAKNTTYFVAYKSNTYGESIPEEQRLERLNRINREITRVCDSFSITLPKVTRMNVLDSNRGMYNPDRDEITFSTNNMERTLRHEFGHVIDIRLNVNNGEWKTLVRSLESKYGFAPSNYARTNESEYWAEAFAGYTSPNYGTTINRFPAELERFIQKVLARISTVNVMTASR